MKIFTKILGLFFVILMCACSTRDAEILQQQIIEIQQKYIPDKRVEYFKVSVVTKETQKILAGSTVSEPAFLELKDLAESNNIEFEVEHLPEKDFKANPWGIVSLSVCNIRSEGNHSAELVTQALLGTPVKIYQEEDGWYLIQTPDRYFGWVDAAGISPKTSNEIQDWKAIPKVIFKNRTGAAVSNTTPEAGIESDLVLGDLLTVTGTENDYYEIVFPDGRAAFVEKSDCISTDKWFNKNFDKEQLLQTAFQFKGVPYLWGGTSPKMFDCSGFTKTVYYYHGLILQRDASQQTLYGEEVDTSGDYDNLQAGDLLFFGRKESVNQPERVTHVGLYIGNSRFIHASGKVRINSLDPMSEDYTEHYEKAFVRARHVVGNVDGNGIEWIVDNAFYKMVLPED